MSDIVIEPDHHGLPARKSAMPEQDVIWTAILNTHAQIAVIDSRTTAHEAVCRERHKSIQLYLRMLILGMAVVMGDVFFDLHFTAQDLLHFIVK